MVDKNESMGLEGIKKTIEDERDIEASTITVSRVLHDRGKFVTPAWTPLLTQKHMIDRLGYCKLHITILEDYMIPEYPKVFLHSRRGPE